MVSADESLKDDFVQDIDGSWVYLGNDINDLADALRENTDALLGRTMAQYEAKA
jgi:hypothetical protein